MSNLIGHRFSGGEQQSARDCFEDIGGNAIVYFYPNGDFDIVCASDAIWHGPGWEGAFAAEKPSAVRPSPREKGKRSEGDDALRSMRRARAKLRRLALSNEFEYFVTLTLDKDKVDRYDPKEVMRKVNHWLDNMVRRCGLRYILVPEQHKDGAWHFHGFFAGDGLETVDSGVRWGGREVFNLPQWTLGFTTAQRLCGKYPAAVAYVCKYIGKQQDQRPMGRWYYSGGQLQRPAKTYVNLGYRDIEQEFDNECVQFDIPGSKILVVHLKGGQK